MQMITKAGVLCSLFTMQLLDGNTCTTRFRLERSPKSLEFETNTDEQKEEWMAVSIKHN